MAASLVPGEGRFPDAPAPADNSAGIAQMTANIDMLLNRESSGKGWARHARLILEQAKDWAATQTGV